jgi:hypothetical protein
MRKVCAKIVPKNLNNKQNAGRNEVSAEPLETKLDFLTWVITSDESWFFKYNPETKRQSEEWYTPVSKTHESSHEQIKNQENGHHFFRLSWGR